MKLGSLEVSRVIQGHWQLAGGHGPVDEKQAVENMKVLYDAGQTTLDTADIYGPSEGIIGKFLKERPGAVVCTKFCCFNGLDRISKEEVRRKITASCKRLGVKQLDLVAFFWLDLNVKRYVQVESGPILLSPRRLLAQHLADLALNSPLALPSHS
jgi:aryl-alcohol dehydrogenase-like predicted oxidoreductase